MSSLLQKRSTPTALPLALDAGTSGTSNVTRKGKGKGKAASAAAADAAATAELNLFATEVAHSAASHRSKLEQHLVARESRLAQLLRASRELELQRHLMGKGTKKEVVVKQKGDKVAKEDEWWMQGVKGAKKSAEEENEGKLPMADEGVATGARVWVSFALSFVLLLFPPSPSSGVLRSPRLAVCPDRCLSCPYRRNSRLNESDNSDRHLRPQPPFLFRPRDIPSVATLRFIPPADVFQRLRLPLRFFFSLSPRESVLCLSGKERAKSNGISVTFKPARPQQPAREGKGSVAGASGGGRRYLFYMHVVTSPSHHQLGAQEGRGGRLPKRVESGRCTTARRLRRWRD